MAPANFPDKTHVQRLQDIICLFEDDFSMDWIIELTGRKPSEVLAELEQGVGEGWLKKTRSGYFAFADLKKRELMQLAIAPHEKELLFR
ncbi:MAG: hypothetical protein JW914_04240 [Syntrophaceae bacterium]|nr:hypothetical protein [Syntrophaceae bacterium]